VLSDFALDAFLKIASKINGGLVSPPYSPMFFLKMEKVEED